MQTKRLYEFGPFSLDAAERVLRRDGVPVQLAPKAFETLLVLVERSGQVVEKAELMRRVWPDTFVEEQNLVFNISILRKTLGEGAEGERYIETVPKRGYRFTSNVRTTQPENVPVVIETRSVTRIVTEEEEEIIGEGDEALPENVRGSLAPEERGDAVLLLPGGVSAQRALVAHENRPVSTPEAHPNAGRLLLSGAPKRRRLGLLTAAAALIAAGMILGYGALRFFGAGQAGPAPSPLTATPFTSFAGFESDPAFSPDGNQVAYAWRREDARDFDIYVQLIGSNSPLRLTSGKGDERDPAWSPDARHIAFIRDFEIYIISALGGPERRVGTVSSGRLDWSPDGKSLVVLDRAADEPFHSMFLLSVESGEKRRLTTPPMGGSGDNAPAFSPDGQTIAFTRAVNSGTNDLYLLPAGGGEPKRLTYDNRTIIGLTWTADGRGIVFSSNRDGGRGLWRIPAQGGAPERLEVAAQNPARPQVSRQGGRLAFVESFTDVNVWRIPAAVAGGQRPSPVKLIASTRYDSSPQYSPDGRRIAFRSDRSGSNEIWLCDSDGSNPLQLTHLNGPLAGSPHWSPDGRMIAFDSRHEGPSRVYVVSAGGGAVRRLADAPPVQVIPSWSKDGRWIYFYSNTDGQVWKASLDGGASVQVTKNKGVAPRESPDGKFLYYAKVKPDSGIWRMPVEGGNEELVVKTEEPVLWGYWAVADSGIYFVELSDSKKIKFFNFATGRVIDFFALEKPSITNDAGLTISPDGQWLLFTQVDQSGSDIMLAENFR